MNTTYQSSVSSKQNIMSIILSKPYIVGYMSVDISRKYRSDLSELKYVTTLPSGRISFDLNHNINNAIKRTSEDNVEKIDLLLKFILDKSDCLDPSVHFITYRRTLIAGMCSAFGLEPIIVVATLFNGHIYLCSLNTPEEVHRKQNKTEQEKKFYAWGYKFEQYMAADLPSLQPNIESPVIENAEFSLFYRATLGSHELLYGAQIDGMLATSGKVSDPPENADHETNLNYLRNNYFVELKTNREIEYRRQEENFRRNKMLKSWCQCYLAGLKGLIVGYRNDVGIIQRLQWFNTIDIVRYCQNIWNPRTATEFLEYFLTFIKNSFKDHVKQTLGTNSNFKKIGPITLRFDVDINKRIKVSETTETILPDWFLDAKKKDN